MTTTKANQFSRRPRLPVVYLDALSTGINRKDSGPVESDVTGYFVPTRVGSGNLSYGLRRHDFEVEDWIKVLRHLQQRHSLHRFALCLGALIAPCFGVELGDSALSPDDVDSFIAFQGGRLLGDRIHQYTLSVESTPAPFRCVTAIPLELAQAASALKGTFLDRITGKSPISVQAALPFILETVPEFSGVGWVLALVTPSYVQVVRKGVKGYQIFAPRDPGHLYKGLHQAIEQAELAGGLSGSHAKWIVRLDCDGPGSLPGWHDLNLGQRFWPKGA